MSQYKIILGNCKLKLKGFQDIVAARVQIAFWEGNFLHFGQNRAFFSHMSNYSVECQTSTPKLETFDLINKIGNAFLAVIP